MRIHYKKEDNNTNTTGFFHYTFDKQTEKISDLRVCFHFSSGTQFSESYQHDELTESLQTELVEYAKELIKKSLKLL